MGILFFLLVAFGPSLWLLVKLYQKWGSLSWKGVAGRGLGALVWPVFCFAILMLANFWYLKNVLSWKVHLPLSQGRRSLGYENVLEAWRDSSRIAHFPHDISPEQVRYFISGPIPLTNVRPFNVFVVLVIDVSPKEAESLYQSAEQNAISVITWRDSTLSDSTVHTERIVLRSRSSSRFDDPSSYMFDVPLPKQKVLIPEHSEVDYVAYVFGPDEPSSNTSYGIAFHKHRSLVIYWAEEEAHFIE